MGSFQYGFFLKCSIHKKHWSQRDPSWIKQPLERLGHVYSWNESLGWCSWSVGTWMDHRSDLHHILLIAFWGISQFAYCSQNNMGITRAINLPIFSFKNFLKTTGLLAVALLFKYFARRALTLSYSSWCINLYVKMSFLSKHYIS